MPTFCAVVGCGMVGGRGYPMYRFPSKFNKGGKFCPLAAERLKRWCQALKREDLTDKKIKYERVCGKHFISGKKADLQDKDHPDWVPSVNLGHESSALTKPSSLDRYKRAICRTQKVETPAVNIVENILEEQQNPQNVEEELTKAFEKIRLLQLQLHKYKFNRENFQNNPDKCRYYTGLPNVDYLDVVYNLIEPYLSGHGLSALSKYERLILTLMKLRKDFDFTELGYKFNIHRETASKIFHTCLFILYKRLRKFIIWPEREILHKTMPDSFKEAFGNRIAVIVDCFEVFIQRPSTLQARSQIFSHYKHHNTIKILIGITPQGSISFVSPAYGGRCSDKFIAENSDFLNHLFPGDTILADRGFSINDSVKVYQAEVITPAYLKGQKQLHPADVEETRRIAHLRIHVERLIGDLREKFEILYYKVPITLLNDDNDISTIDQITTVCCALVNLCPPIVN